MAIGHEGPAPYTSPSAVIQIVERFRDRGLQTPFDPEVLVRAGTSEGLAQRTLHSLRQLDLIDEEGNPTDALEGLRRAPSDDFKTRFAEVVQAAYAPIFQYADPAKDSIDRIRDAFRPYVPHGQQARMVTLFLGLCEYAEISSPRAKVPPQSRAVLTRAPRSPSEPRGPAKTPRTESRSGPQDDGAEHIPPAILGLLRQALPREGRAWTPLERERFLRTFEAVLDFSVPVGDSDPEQEVASSPEEVSG